jgi:hypothetical protein
MVEVLAAEYGLSKKRRVRLKGLLARREVAAIGRDAERRKAISH